VSDEPVYLCTIDEFAGGPGASDDHVLRRMTLLAGILNKLGWDLASGTAPNFHELWAIRPETPGLGDNGGTPEAGG